MPKKLILVGAGGHGKVIADIALKCGYDIVGFLDDDTALRSVLGRPVLGGINKLEQYQVDCEFVVSIGANSVRKKIMEQYPVRWATLIHPFACIGIDVTLGAGTVVMANAVINPSSSIGRGCIINTGTIIEHDNLIGDYVHVSPNATLCGTVRIDAQTHVGAGATIRNNVTICAGCVIGAGSMVVGHIREQGTYAGVPAKRLV